MRTIVCPECGGDGYTERIKGDQAFDRKPCEKCGGEGDLEDTVSLDMLGAVNTMVGYYEDIDDLWCEDFDDSYAAKEQMNDLASALYELQSILKARCK